MENFADYKIIKKTGENNSSVFYHAKNIYRNKDVILKTLKKVPPLPEDVLKFENEYKITKSLTFEGIIHVLEIEFISDNVILIFDYFDGIPLSEANTNYFELETFLNIAISITDTLDKLHKNNIIHKNINPDNIFFNLETQQVKLTGFNISSVIDQKETEIDKISNIEMYEDNLAYISPEQTGRMNCPVDYRTDFYSLGATLYKILTGKFLFESNDMMELIHFHIAREPVSPAKISPDIPEALSDIIMKLLSKNPKDRYKSCYGLKFDLELCQEMLMTSGEIINIIPGKHDSSDQLEIPHKFYGRTEELKQLTDIYSRVKNNNPELLVINGPTGIGKSALVEEARKIFIMTGSYFTYGQAEQFKSETPYLPFIYAFKGLIRILLTRSEEKIIQWKKDLIESLGNDLEIVISHIPEIEMITGKISINQQEIKSEHINLSSAFKKLFSIFTKEDQPLTIFLDDIQWIDNASLNLIKALFKSQEIKNLFVIAAYKDESEGENIAEIIQKEINSYGVQVSNIHLGLLAPSDINQFLSDTFNCSLDKSKELALILAKKTNSNIFFISEFLKTLHKEKIIFFNPKT